MKFLDFTQHEAKKFFVGTDGAGDGRNKLSPLFDVVSSAD
jgi:hypothetical protein